MQIIPAIDLLGGSCVRLHQGDYDQVTRFSDDPVAQALSWQDQVRSDFTWWTWTEPEAANRPMMRRSERSQKPSPSRCNSAVVCVQQNARKTCSNADWNA